MDLFSTLPEQPVPVQATAPEQLQPKPQPDIPYTEPDKYAKDTKERLLAYNVGTYDTRKVLNRSTRAIPQQVVDSIEGGKVTSEMIDDLGKQYPVFRYQSCITVHGSWPEVQRERIAGYKNIRQNGNGSVEILWTAIDADKKEAVGRMIRWAKGPAHYRVKSTGTSYEIDRSVNRETWADILKELKETAERVRKVNALARVTLYRWSSYGGDYLSLQVDVMGLPEGQEHALAAALCNVDNDAAFVDKVQAGMDKEAEEERKYEREREERKATNEKFEQQQKEAAAKMHEALKGRPYANIEQEAAVRVNEGNAYTPAHYLYFRVTEKAAFGRVKYQFARHLTLDEQPKWKDATKALSKGDLKERIKHQWHRTW
jgi:hypothetical protein